MYAIIEIKGHQYIVKKDMEIIVDKVFEDEDLKCEKVLGVFDDNQENVKIGKPYLDGVSVEFDRIEDKKGDKIRVLKFHRKNRYKKVYGFRPHQTVLKIKNIVL